MKKAVLRKQALEQRKSLSTSQLTLLSQGLLAQFKLLDLSAVRVLHIFLPIVEKNEPDTFLIIEWLAEFHPEIRIIVPRADFDTALMQNYIYEGKESLRRNLYQILEPEKGHLHTGDVDLVLVPLLGFDLKGYRAGYGKGFYDRFLSGIQTFKVGLSLFEPIAQIEDFNEHDVRMDCCLTPDKTYFF
ncbi:5-formyltetrahydrofolate cyclo-ligase [Pedobacter sp. GR22-6]|uniref:5-formyltetrahydrofolate cyclo-ligase n=1 Tax=Pedobacter sp. GR22-6 TaxID=3127957 RepID=UPI00307E10F1